MNFLDFDFRKPIKKLGKIMFGKSLGEDIYVKDDVVESVREICRKNGRFGDPPDILRVFVVPNDKSQYETFGKSFMGRSGLKSRIEEVFRNWFSASQTPSIEVVLCDPDQEVPPPVQKGLDVEMPSDTENQYYLHTTRYEVTAARLHCEYGLVHEDPVDIQDRDRVYLGRGHEVSPDNRHRLNHFAFLNPQNPESAEEEERINEAPEDKVAALRIIHRDHAEIEQEGRRYRIYPGHPSYEVRIKRSDSRLLVTSEGQSLENGDRIVLMPDGKGPQLREYPSIRVELETQEKDIG